VAVSLRSCHYNLHKFNQCIACGGGAKANGWEPISCLGRVFHFRLGSFVVIREVHGANARYRLKLKTRSRCCPVSLSLSMVVSLEHSGRIFDSFLVHCNQWLRAGNTNWKGKWSTVDLLFKIAFVEKDKKVLLMQSRNTKNVCARRSTVLSLPLKLVLPAQGHFPMEENQL